MLKTGKLDSDLLEAIVFKHIKYRRPEVITRPGIGEDCAVLDFDPYDCVLSTDPITAAVKEIGSLSVHISCNDIASNGVQPLGILLAVLLPEGTTESEIDEIMKKAAKAAEEMQVEIIGGHTEITAAVNKPVIVSTAVGRAKRNPQKKTYEMAPGDSIIVTKLAGLEGTGIIALDHRQTLIGILSEEEIAIASDMLSQVSVVPEGVIAGEVGVSRMHDITEGGVLGAVWELCSLSDVGAEIWEDKIPVADVTRKIAQHFNIDPLRLISSGSMMIIVPRENKNILFEKLAEAKIQGTEIGIVKEKEAGIKLESNGEWVEIQPPGADEIYKV